MFTIRGRGCRDSSHGPACHVPRPPVLSLQSAALRRGARLKGHQGHAEPNWTLAPPLQHQALATSGQAAAHRIPPVQHVFGEERGHPCHAWRTTSRPTTVIISCSISGNCSRCANTATAAARNSRKHTATNATSGLMAGRSIRTIQRIGQGLKGDSLTRAWCLSTSMDVCGCHGALTTRSPRSFRWAEGGITEKFEARRM